MTKKRWSQKNIKQSRDTNKKPNYKLWSGILVMVFIVGALLYVSRLPKYQISRVSIENDVITKEEDVLNITDSVLSSKYIGIIPKSNIWLYPKSQILKKIKSLPSVESVTGELDTSSNTLNIYITERKHEYVWCGESCFYMNRLGYVFAPAPKFEGNLFLVFRGVFHGDPLEQVYLPKADMDIVIGFIDALDKLGFKIVEVNIVSRDEVRFVLNTQAEVIVSMNDDLSEVQKNLKILSLSEDFIHASGGLDKIEYIDMRYGKKAFWK
jgi:cell division septal protein FtsQ